MNFYLPQKRFSTSYCINLYFHYMMCGLQQAMIYDIGCWSCNRWTGYRLICYMYLLMLPQSFGLQYLCVCFSGLIFLFWIIQHNFLFLKETHFWLCGFLVSRWLIIKLNKVGSFLSWLLLMRLDLLVSGLIGYTRMWRKGSKQMTSQPCRRLMPAPQGWSP